MKLLYDLWKNPASRYGFLGATAAFFLIGSFSTLPWLAVCGSSMGIGLLLTVGIEVIGYFKSISDEAKHTLVGLNDTLEEAKKAVSRVTQEFEDAPKGKPPTLLQNVRGVVSRVNKELEDAPEGNPPTILQNVKGAIARVNKELEDPPEGEPVTLMQNVKGIVSKVNKELGEAPEGEEPTLAQAVKKTIGEVGDTVDQGRSGWAGWFLNINKRAKNSDKPKAAPKSKVAPEPQAAPSPKKINKKAEESVKKNPRTPVKALKAVPAEEVDNAAVDEALATFDKPASEKTTSQKYHHAVKIMKRNQFAQALEEFKAIETLHPKSDEADLATLQTIKCYLSMHDNTRALALAERFIKEKPKHEDADYAYYMKAMIHFDVYQKGTDKKQELAKKALDAFHALRKNFPKSEYTSGSKDEITELEDFIKGKSVDSAKAKEPAKAPSQTWGDWAKSWVPSFSLFGSKADSPPKSIPQPALRKSTRLATQKN